MADNKNQIRRHYFSELNIFEKSLTHKSILNLSVRMFAKKQKNKDEKRIWTVNNMETKEIQELGHIFISKSCECTSVMFLIKDKTQRNPVLTVCLV